MRSAGAARLPTALLLIARAPRTHLRQRVDLLTESGDLAPCLIGGLLSCSGRLLRLLRGLLRLLSRRQGGVRRGLRVLYILTGSAADRQQGDGQYRNDKTRASYFVHSGLLHSVASGNLTRFDD